MKYSLQDVEVVRIPDGDTFSVNYVDRSGEHQEARVRIMGIDCPESSQPYGREARDLGRSMAMNEHVTLHVHTEDRYGRLVADVDTPDGRNYGLEMLRAGAAWHYKAYDRRSTYANAENDARRAQIGLWAAPDPEEPWAYRKRKREGQ